MVTAIANEAKRLIRGSTPAMIEKEIASGMRARATTKPASTSVRSRRGERRAPSTDTSGTERRSEAGLAEDGTVMTPVSEGGRGAGTVVRAAHSTLT